MTWSVICLHVYTRYYNGNIIVNGRLHIREVQTPGVKCTLVEYTRITKTLFA